MDYVGEREGGNGATADAGYGILDAGKVGYGGWDDVTLIAVHGGVQVELRFGGVQDWCPCRCGGGDR